MSGGTKHDAEKIRLDLLSTQWLSGVGKVLTFGAKKYAAHNWRQGIEMSRLMGAALRHITAYNGGEDNDPETGLSHLWHASCCLMFASELRETHPELDDRYAILAKGIPEKNCKNCGKLFDAHFIDNFCQVLVYQEGRRPFIDRATTKFEVEK